MKPVLKNQAEQGGAAEPLPGSAAPGNLADGVLEQTCVFGDGCALTGVYTPSALPSSHQPCAVFLTAGLLHHVGPTRLHVEMARALADIGVPGLRFDLSGVGDSETSSLGGYFMDRSVQEVVQCMDFAQKQYGHDRFVLFGLCSGADDALAAALKDSRVAGIVLLNGYAYPAGLFKWHRLLSFYLPRLFMIQKIRNRVSALLAKVLNRKDVSPAGNDMPRAELPLLRELRSRIQIESGERISRADQAALNALDDDYRYIPPQEITAENLQSLADQRTDMLFIYTGSEHETYTYQGQLLAMFPGLKGFDNVSELYLPEADHTVILEKDRCTLVAAVARWYESAGFIRRS